MDFASLLPGIIALIVFLVAMKSYKHFGISLCFAAISCFIVSSAERELNEHQLNSVLAETSKQGDAGEFAANSYKACVHPTGLFVKNGNPIECKVNVITLAAAYRDQAFAKDVYKALESIN